MVRGITAVIGLQSDMSVALAVADGAAASRLPGAAAGRDRARHTPARDERRSSSRSCGRRPEARILVLSSSDGHEDIYRALKAGAQGYLFKKTPSTEILKAIREVAAGRPQVPDVSARLVERLPRSSLSARGEVCRVGRE